MNRLQLRTWVACLLPAALPLTGHAQDILNKSLSLELHRCPLAQVLDTLGTHGHFSFSYNSSILNGDSPITALFRQVTLRAALDELLGKGYVYVQQGNYLIILRDQASERTYQLSGYIRDENTGQGIDHASVYVKEQLQSTLTDGQGFFRLSLRVRSPTPVLTISKEWYIDKDTILCAGYDQTLAIGIAPAIPKELSPVFVSSPGVERTWWGRLFLSSRQRVQSLNLAHFFTSGTAQVSLVPWVGTNGMLSGQVTNAYSFNLIGGYSAGLRGEELGGVFNIDKKDVHGGQVAGAVNLVGGTVHGVQAAGIINYVIDSLKGLQMAGLINVVKGNVEGVQVAGYLNVCKDTLRGVQVSLFDNLAHRLEGVQIGLINKADSSFGYSIGLISLVKYGGVHRLSFSMDAVTGITAEYTGGNQKLNSILLVGYNPWSSDRLFSYGYGIGRDFTWKGRWGIYGEVSVEELLNDHWTRAGTVNRIRPVLTFRAAPKIHLFAGPSFSLSTWSNARYNNNQVLDVVGKRLWPDFRSQRTDGWIGLCAGISFF